MAEPLVTYRGVVYPWQCDHMGHMNVMWYIGKFDEGTWQLFAALGLSPARLRSSHVGMAAVEQHVKYRRELHAGDVVSIRSWILAVTEKSIRFAHEMRNDETNEVAASTVVVGVHLDTLARRSCPLPDDVREGALLLVNPIEP